MITNDSEISDFFFIYKIKQKNFHYTCLFYQFQLSEVKHIHLMFP